MPTPTYCWGQFATNGRGNRNTSGPLLSLTDGTLVGENLHGVVISSGDVGLGVSHLWIYVRLHLPNKIIYDGSNSHASGFFCRRIASSVASLDCYINHFRLNQHWEVVKKAWDRKDYVTPNVETQLSAIAPGGQGYQDFVVIHEANVPTENAKLWISANGSSWNEIVNDTITGLAAFSGGFPLCFNGYLTQIIATNPPDSQLVECCVREGGAYSDAENLQILQNGMEASFGL